MKSSKPVSNTLGEDGSYRLFTLFCTEFIKEIRLPHYTANKTQEDYHTIKNWAQNGFFNTSSKKEGGWAKFSLLDLIWIKIVKELKIYGLSSKRINLIKEYIFNNEAGSLSYKLDYYLYRESLGSYVYLYISPTEGCYFQENTPKIGSVLDEDDDSCILLGLENITRKAITINSILCDDYNRCVNLLGEYTNLITSIKNNSFNKIEILFFQELTPFIIDAKDTDPVKTLLFATKDKTPKQINFISKEGQSLSVVTSHNGI